MKITVRVEVTTDYGESATFEICDIDRPYRELDPAKVRTPRFLTLPPNPREVAAVVTSRCRIISSRGQSSWRYALARARFDAGVDGFLTLSSLSFAEN